MIDEVSREVHADVDERHPDDIRLDERIVPHEDRVNGHLADAVPEEDGLDDRRAAEQRADGERQERDDRDERRLQHIAPQDPALRHTSCARAVNIRLSQFLEHDGADLPRVLRAHGDCKRDGRQDNRLHPAARTHDGQHAELQRKNIDEQQRHEEIWQRVADERQEADEVIDRRILPHSGEDTEREGKQHRQRDRREHELHGRRQVLCERVKHELARDVRPPHVARHDAAEPVAVLHEERPVEAELVALLCLDFFRYAARLLVHDIDGIVRRKLHHAKRQERDADEDRDELQQARQHIAFHPRRPLSKTLISV